MGQQLFKVHLDINDKIQVDSETILSIACKDDINFFLPLKSSGRNIIASDLNVGHQIPNAHAESVKEIRNDLALLTELIEWQAMNTKINDILTSDVFTILSDQNKKLIADINDYLAYKQSLEKCLMEKLKDDSNDNTPILAYSFIDYSSSHATSSSTKTEDQKSQKAKYLSKQLSYLAIQSLTSILLVLIKSAEKNDPSIVHHILTLAGELCQQFPMKCLSPANIFLFKSLKPLINYIHELSLTEDSIISKQATIILLAFSIAKGSFKDILSLLNKLIFNTTDIYNVQGLFIQLNNGLEETLNDAEKQTASSEETEDTTSIGYLKSIGSFPNTQLTNLNEQLFTGQFISSIILSYIDIENRANLLTEEIELSSFSCEFHPSTFKNLFNIIEQLAAILPSSQSSNTIKHILTICLRLFSAHIKILSDIKTDNTNIDLSKFIIDDDLKKWFDLLFKLACSENSEQLNMSKEASKVLINIINIQSSVLTEKISLIHQYIVQNKSPILTEQFLIELNNNEILTNWIDTLCDENKRNSLIQILYSFIDLYFNRPDEQKLLIEKLLLSFQQNLLSRLIHRCENKTLPNDELSLSSLIAEYLTHMFNNCLLKVSHVNNLLSSILIGLCSMTKLDEIFVYEIVQPIFLAVLPLLAEYYLKNLEHEYHELICYILGKMSHLLIIGSPQDSLEIKHSNQLKLAIFAGGYINGKNTSLLNSNLAVYSKFPSVYETEDDKDFLMSIYNNIDDGAKLISKLQMSIKHKQRLLQKSIEQQAHDACAAVFAVYIKFYRRINLAKYELSRTDPTNPHNELISIYEYANHVSTLFSTVKAQGGDCDELLKQIKMKTLFLLSSVKESSLIPIINEQMPSIIINMIPDNTLRYQRQHSRWTKANHVIKLLRNLLQACFRFRNSILRKKQLNEQKCNFESLLHHAIDHFIYEDCHKISSSINNEEKQSKIDEIETCLRRQQERAVTRLIAYRFIRTFLQNVLNENNNSQHLTIVSIYLPYLVENDLEWSYLKNISASNNQLQEEIGSCYYSIIQLVLSLCFKSDSLLQKLFYLLNLPYEIIDLCQLYQYEFVQTLFKSFVSFKQTSEHETSLNLKFISFNWFRLYIFKLCGNVEMERQKGILNEILEEQDKLAFNTSILNELKDLIKQSNEESAIDSQEQKKISLSNITHCWFVQADENSDADDNESSASHKHEIELYKSQYLVLLLQCTYYYKHVLMVCANIDYLRELLNIYHNSQLSLTRILTIKLLGSLIPRIPDTVDDQSKYLIKKFLTDVLNSIGENKISEELLAELIYMYRTIMSLDSSWKIMATTLVLDSVKLYLNLESIELNDSERMNKLLAALCILGEYIEPFRLGSIVTVNADKKLNDESSLALIIEIDSNFGETEKYYLIQYFQTRQTETVSIDKLKLEINVSPPNLSNLEESFLDVLGYFIQIDTSTSQSLILLELKRRSISVLYNILNDRKFAEIFMKKPYASTIAKLCVCDSLEKIRQLSPDLDLSTKENLERYSLTLDTGEIFESMTEDESKDVLDHSISTNNHDDSLYTIWNTDDFKPDELIMNNLSKPISKSNTWKPYASEIEMDFVKQGRSGKDEVVIVPTPLHSVALDAIQECGTKHRFRGKIAPTSQTARVSFPSFIADNLQLSEGNWYFCVRLPLGGVVQIGWATNGFSPSIGCGVGDDRFSWSYDGSRAAFFYEEGFYGQYDNTHWGQNAVCGCGIEIDGLNTRIKFWLNGKYLGTAFQHDTFVPLSTKTCNLLPNGPKTKFFPGVTMQYGSDPSIYCELIFSPEDMESCPLPNGYKPLLLPKCVLTENSIVEYPFSAYLIGENPEDFVYSTRANSSVVLLRDFMYQHHLENKFSFDNHHLILSEQSTGFPLSIDNDDMTSLTISFDFQILTSNEKSDILLFKIESTEIIVNITNETIRCTIVFLAKKRRIKVYINNKCRLFIDAFQRETIKKLNLNLLPTIAAKIRNLAIWKYALAEGDIRRLFTYGLFYIAVENQRLREHRQQANTISFSKNQTNFTDECLIPFNESFKEDVWTKKKTQADDNESNYFKTNNDIDYSVVELLGNQTYLHLNIDDNINGWILDKSSIETDQNNQYHLFDFNKTEEKSKISKKSEGSDKTISSTKSLISRTDCEHGLTTIYARCTILNMIKLWLYDQTSLFPLEKFGDFPFVIKLLKLLDSMQIDIDEKDDRINLLINSILKSEMKNLLESKITVDEHLLESKSPLFYHLQKHIFIQSIQLVSKPSLFDQNSNGKTSINEQQPDFAFVLKVLKLFMELIRARSSLEQNQIESIISLLFPTQLINLAFDLFLLVPVHQSKIAIIHLFTTLLQTSEQLILNNEIQQFFFQLLIELSSKAASLSNYSLKHLQLALADFIFILITKLKHLSNENSGKIKVIETKLPENIQNLYTIIDVINIWTDPKREKLLPEKFLLKSDNYKISQEDFTNSNNHFNTIADQDLINFMNNELLANDSFSKFIEKLPKESPADSTFFKNHLSLTNIPADCIRIRAQFFYSFNTLLTETLSIVDFSLPLGESFLTDRIRIIKPYLLSTTKFGLFQESLDNTESDQNTEWTLVNFDTLKASTDISNSENTMFYQAYQQMRNNAHIIFRRPNEQLWHAQYIGMHSTDHGGPYRDSITRICSDICSTRLPLFILCPNGRTNSGLNRDCWIPNVFPPHESIENTITKQYRFVGQLLGMAIRRKHYLNVKFPSLLWKQLSNEPITVEDIEAIDSQSFTIINEAEKNIEQIRSVTAAGAESDVDSLFSSIMSELRFDVVSSSGQTYELIPDGSNIPITVENFKQYCKYYRQYRLNEFNRQIDFIRQGLHNIVPCYYLSLFTANELEEATCGKDRIDIELLQRHVCYGGCYSEESPPIERFWKVLNEMFNEDQKKALLIFAWGRSTLPIRDEDFDMKFCISEFDVYDSEVDKTLPRSHTCFFTIDLPAYSTTDIMYERLNYAISSCSSIDGDGTVNETHSSENGDLYNSSDDE
ncbi:unnamed protein product [Rotaria socialis]|uniref:B30.2/SPRY domain-containing protein n=1 Tax=Rotaria socialis TaxID=392032 RepID=A0A820THY8_9BILA|nr:unnamed protein product [Rotaria socialis]